ncbi:MAG: hypothetical protein CFH06_00189 [Alphaproteobacteria bacterium MarineAlpha3_Bin5]|nr:MAG: hypothetical protein CFH06_00189 [Alphaproteobacteria bacterium MarineAlpha3_Bin5]
MRIPTFTMILLTGFVTISLFAVKYRVQTLNNRIMGMEKEIAEDRESIHVLQAEWSHLNEPDRLRNLAIRHLNLHSIDSSRIISFDQIDQTLPAKYLDIQKGSQIITEKGTKQ